MRAAPNLSDPSNEPTQRDWQRLAARALKGVEQRHTVAMQQMLERIDRETEQAQERAARFKLERKTA